MPEIILSLKEEHPPCETKQLSKKTDLLMVGLSKSRVIAHLQCPKRLWLQINRPKLIVVEATQQARMDAGNVVGDLARQLYPGGILIDGDDLNQAITDTASVLAQTKRHPVFEATFRQDSVLVRNDLLLPVKGGYHLAEVKSSTTVKDYHLNDVALQAHVTAQAGVPLKKLSVVHIDNTFVYPGNENYDGLFHFEDMTETARELMPLVPQWIKAAQETLAGPEPVIEPGPQCHDPFDCPFMDYCHPPEDLSAHPVELLPYAQKLAVKLREEGFTDIRDIPKGRLTTDRHVRIWTAVTKGKPVLDKAVRDAMSPLAWPRYFIDFETITFAAPIWAGTRPYQQIPFQWSCHVESHTGTLKHTEWLAPDAEDPRLGFVESLIRTIGKRGSLLAYNAAFERKRLEELAEAFPSYAEPLLDLVERMVDLLQIARDHYYHPDMRGSWSIKRVLPTIDPELSYQGLSVADGGMAQEAFMALLDPAIPEEEKAKIRQDLLTYCERDTFAMVEIARFFEGKRR